ncbi:MAG: alkaline phosphatase family protein [Desulfobacterales bacterium]|jgi:2,3-bisphosphoglycerate-independent phosphoglycerate mutase|nr:alkaline phosphatase family protein [Desulfobacterales bacterium]
MKIILILLDGVGDRSYPALNFRTPLEAARTPNMDKLAAMGSNGLYHASALGECLPSENAHFMMFGYEREKFPGRGVLEAVGYDIPFNDPDVLCLCHFSKIKVKNGIPFLFKGRDDVKGTAKETGRLYRLMSSFTSGGVSFKLHQTKRNDGIIVISGDASPYISDSDPIRKGEKIARIMPVMGNPEPEKARQTAEALNAYLAYCRDQLKNSGMSETANYLVTQRCARRIVQTPFNELWGMRPMMIASSAVYAGLAHELGFAFVRAKDTGHPGKDMKQRVRLALDDQDHDFYHVHTKMTDEISHHGNAIQKKEIIEDLDSGMNELVDAVSKRKDLLVVVTGDHSTPSDSMLVHSGESVPVIMAGSKIRRDRVDRFDEISAAGGCLGLMRGRELMQMMLNSSERSMLTGLCLGETVRPYFPANYPPFPLK